MIPLGRIRATPKNGDFMGVPQKNEYFRAKNERRRPPRRPYSCTNPKSRDSRLELDNSRLTLDEKCLIRDEN